MGGGGGGIQTEEKCNLQTICFGYECEELLIKKNGSLQWYFRSSPVKTKEFKYLRNNMPLG